MRFSRAKPKGSFRVLHPSTRRVAGHADTLAEARKDASYWVKASRGLYEIQEKFPSGAWVTVETVGEKTGVLNVRGGGRQRARLAEKHLASRKSTHATKRNAHAAKKTGDKISIADLAKMFNLPDWDRIDDLNQQHYWQMAKESVDDPNDEDEMQKAEEKAQQEIYHQWYDAVEHVGDNLFGEHGLELKQIGKKGRSFELKITPQNSWNDAANKIRETVNGEGMFGFSTLKEFLDSGPYTAKQAVLSHLGYIRHYPAIYGGTGARTMFDNAFER
jgi:hypothetical protein